MNGYDVYCSYVALKAHFLQPHYDYHKFQGKTTVNVSSFERRGDKPFFMKLARHRDAEGFMLANIVYTDPFIWIGDMIMGVKNYNHFLKVHESLGYIFKQDLAKLPDDLNSLVRCQGDHPLILKYYLRREIELETLVILCHLMGLWEYWNRRMVGDPLFAEIALKLSKYPQFIRFDEARFLTMVKDRFT